MQLEDYLKRELKDFKGLWSRGEDDSCPIDHFLDCLNVDYRANTVLTRPGLSTGFSVGYASGRIARFACTFNPAAIIHLILDESGNLYTYSNRAGDTATTPLITVAGATDFSALQMFGRIYIAFHDGLTGLPATNLKVYIPNTSIASDVIRSAAGAAPTAGGAMAASTSGTEGIVNVGRYKIAVANVTTTGFITPPGPKVASVFTPTEYIAPGKHRAYSLLTASANVSNNDTVTIGTETYTFKSSLTASGSVPNEILIGATANASLNNLGNAIMGLGTVGVDYGANTRNSGVTVEYIIGDVLLVSSNEEGTKGNDVATAESSATLSWTGSTMAGGSDGKKISMSSIPTGPSGTAKRQILITKADEEEYFFLPSAFGGLINDNSTTTATLDFDDITDLVDSADYLFDLLETIPAPVGLSDFSDRMLTWGESGNDSIIRVSYRNDIESFDSIDGIVPISKDDGFVCTNGMEMRDIFYAGKSLGVHAFEDNNDVPANWRPYEVDRSINICSHGIAEFFSMSGVRIARDMIFVVDRSGILSFSGTFTKPPLTYKIDDIWQRLNFAYYKKVVLVVDEQTHKMYCSFPIDNATECDTLIVGDYSECGDIPDAYKIKWSIYQYKPGGSLKAPNAIGLTAILGEDIPTFKLASITGGGKLWKRDEIATTDDGTVIESYIETSLLFWEDGFIHFFNAVQMKLTGSGSLLITIRGEDNVDSANIRTIATTSEIVFLGDGLNDLSKSGTYSGGSNKEFVIIISTAAGTDKFRYSTDGGETFSSEISITGAAQLLADGVSVTFGVTTGHTLNDVWMFTGFNNPLTLETAPGRHILTTFNFQNEKAKLKFRLTSGYFMFSKITIFGKPIYSMRPA